METKIKGVQMEKVRRSCGFTNGIEVDSIGSKGGLSLAWRGDVDVSLQSFSNRHIDVFIDDNSRSLKWRLTGFYGSPYMHDRDESWNLLRHLSNGVALPWLVIRDFNEILYGFEKRGGVPREERRMEGFRKVLADCNLADVGYLGNWFTWERGNLAETNIQGRLDRGVANDDLFSIFPNYVIQHLPHSFSDHCPLFVLTDREDSRIIRKEFKFEAWWIMKGDFFEVVRHCWENTIGDLLVRLESLKTDLRKWAFQISHNRKFKKEELSMKLLTLLESERTDENLIDLIDTKIQLNFEIEKDECYWE
ncbi:hypothetical protein J1N35_043172 [Gossypium stocksii]|uniref:Reverse transcriptase n=1 Tax=Gossypium stocksii TaxID=47602 RepID=A0A9D3ZF54_9ROSI|nr:hypothetical protein J1N35_043172 [Gossypium stocksii]